MMAAASPRAVGVEFQPGQPCAEINNNGSSRSMRRRMRDRRVAVRRSLLQTMELKCFLMQTSSNSSLRAAAPEFNPCNSNAQVEVDWNSCVMVLTEEDVQTLPKACVIEPVGSLMSDDVKAPRRKSLRDTGRAEVLNVPSGSSEGSDAANVAVVTNDAIQLATRTCMGTGRGAHLHKIGKGSGSSPFPLSTGVTGDIELDAFLIKDMQADVQSKPAQVPAYLWQEFCPGGAVRSFSHIGGRAQCRHCGSSFWETHTSYYRCQCCGVAPYCLACNGDKSPRFVQKQFKRHLAQQVQDHG